MRDDLVQVRRFVATAIPPQVLPGIPAATIQERRSVAIGCWMVGGATDSIICDSPEWLSADVADLPGSRIGRAAGRIGEVRDARDTAYTPA